MTDNLISPTQTQNFRRFRRQRPRRTKRTTTQQQIAVLNQRVSKMQREVEFKSNTGSVTGSTFSGSWTGLNPANSHLTDIGQGSGSGQRTGRALRVHSVELRGELILPSTNGVTNANVKYNGVGRLVLFVDTQTDGASITFASIFENVGNVNDQFPNLDLGKRIRFLYDREFNINRGYLVDAAGGAAYAQCNARVDFTIRHRFKDPLLIVASSTGAGIANFLASTIQLVGAASDTTTINYTYRVMFSDV
jgi:hypothetical protein